MENDRYIGSDWVSLFCFGGPSWKAWLLMSVEMTEDELQKIADAMEEFRDALWEQLEPVVKALAEVLDSMDEYKNDQ